MESREIFIGANVEEAIAAGLAALGCSRDQVEVEVLDEGSPGFLGLGARPARVRVVPLAPPEPVVPPEPEAAVTTAVVEPSPEEEPGLEDIARAVVTELLERMGIAAEIRTRHAEPETEEEIPPLILNIQGEAAESLIGRRGETLAAFQHIVRLLVGRQLS
ncbi:MAG TPA: hypothetical protein EYP52_06280, partial [Anaerolineae bacterium]|nr:hypothetical protein [Anaerolineae bacterium]